MLYVELKKLHFFNVTTMESVKMSTMGVFPSKTNVKNQQQKVQSSCQVAN